MKPASLHEDSWEDARAEKGAAEPKASPAAGKGMNEAPADEFEMAVDAVEEGQEAAEKEG